MRSHSGCSICKRRKLKCDEIKPVCGPCKKSSRACDFPVAAMFRTGNRPHAGGRDGNVTSRDDEALFFGNDHVWIEVPKSLTFVSSSSPAHGPGTVAAESTVEPSTKRRRVSRETTKPCHDNEVDGYSQDSSATTAAPSAASVDESQLYFEAPAFDHQSPTLCCPDEPVIAVQLMKHFKDGPGRWLDLFDTAAYYSSRVPLKAMTSPLLKSSMCALSAKHIHRTRSTSRGSRGGYPADAMAMPNSGNIDWQFYSTEYYRQAISHLQAAARSDNIESSSPSVVKERACIFTAVAILSMYELMDKPGTAWRAHLSAIPLFSRMVAHSPPYTSESPISICRPVFWSLARQDFLCAFISETQTRLHVEDAQLWRSAGLSLGGDDKGGTHPHANPSGPVVMGTATDDEEDNKANEMIWLLSSIINHLTKGDSLVPEDYARPATDRCPVGVTQEQLFERWRKLDTVLQDWFARLPPSFMPGARTPFTGQGHPMTTNDCLARFEQIWYGVPLCAAAMQSYHMARILLLVNRPQESTAIRSSVTARLGCYQRTLQESLYHAREICGISLADPPDAVRLHSLEPLYVAGQVFRSFDERRAVLGLFRAIQRDLGWSTAYHVENLQREWQEEGDWVLDDGAKYIRDPCGTT